MGKVSVERFKSAMADHFLHKTFPSLFMHFRLRPSVFQQTFREIRVNRDSRHNSFVSDSVFPSLFNGIRHGRFSEPVSYIHHRDVIEPQRSPSNFRIIPIKVDDGKNEKSTKALKDVNPIILDDDLLEVTDFDTNKPSASYSPKGDSKSQNKYSSSHKNGTDVPIILDDDDVQEMVHQNDSSCCLQKSPTVYYSEVTRANIDKSEPVQHLELTVDHSTSKNLNTDNSCCVEKNTQLTNSIVIKDDHKDNAEVGVSNKSISSDPCYSGMVSMKERNSHFEELEPSSPPSYPVYDMLKIKLMNENRRIHYINGDGNCFFRALSKILFGREMHHKAVRGLIIDIIATNKSKFAQFIDGDNVQNHIDKMSEDHCWATTCEIYAAATFLQRDIFMLTPDHLDNYYWLLFKPVFKMAPGPNDATSQQCYITLCNTNGIHYDLVVPDHGKCNCFLPHPELDGICAVIDLT